MNPAIVETLKSTKARFVYAALALMAVFKFIGDFKVPGDRIGYLGSAFAYVWPDLLVLVVLVLLFAFRRWWLTPLRQRLAAAWSGSMLSGRVALGLSLALLAATGVALAHRAGIAYHQTASAVDSRLQVYYYAFGFRYSDSLRARAVGQLQAGRPESADKLLMRAEKWTFGSPTLSDNIKELRALAQSRIELSSALAKGVSRAQASQLAYVTTAELNAAYVLNTESDGLRALLVDRSVQVRRFGRFLDSVLPQCGATVTAAQETTFGGACTQFAAEQFDARADSCRDAARLYCQRVAVAAPDRAARRQATRGFITAALGTEEIRAILGDSGPTASR